ncbi:MAG TPA: Holliday junction resolvase RuvX [Candidatus Dormibacteraeota bacterium]|nr:Holliday junction resolvase RuvX [Candidatus Dormibacteraeota bacterium]
MRILAVDPGTKRVGLALSDPTATIASALVTVEADPSETLAARLAAIAAAQEAERVIVGLPRNLDGSRGPAAAAAERLATDLRKASKLPVETVDERLTTVVADRSLLAAGATRRERRLAVDRVAATLLLQGYLDRMKSDKRRAG